jgi:hypothetical protein
VLDWNEAKNEAEVLLVDFGNKTFVSIDTTTRISETLRVVKPLAINCCLNFHTLNSSLAYEQLVELVTQEIRFDVRMKRADFDRYFDDDCLEACGEFKCPITLIISTNGLELSVENLSDEKVWENIKSEQTTNDEKEVQDGVANNVDHEYIKKKLENIQIEPVSFSEYSNIVSDRTEQPQGNSCAQEAKQVILR